MTVMDLKFLLMNSQLLTLKCSFIAFVQMIQVGAHRLGFKCSSLSCHDSRLPDPLACLQALPVLVGPQHPQDHPRGFPSTGGCALRLVCQALLASVEACHFVWVCLNANICDSETLSERMRNLSCWEPGGRHTI